MKTNQLRKLTNNHNIVYFHKVCEKLFYERMMNFDGKFNVSNFPQFAFILDYNTVTPSWKLFNLHMKL